MEPNGMRRITEAAQAIQLSPDAGATVEEIVAQAPRLLPEFQHVCLSLVKPTGTMETLARTTELAAHFDALQSRLKQGPCVDAALDGTVIVKNAAHEQRWPKYIPAAVALGLHSQIGVRLHSQKKGQIGLNLYSTTHGEFDTGSVGVAEHFAVHAGLALGQVQREDQLRTAVGTRTIIGTAVGVVMERYGIDQAEAFAYLIRQSNTKNQKLRLTAKELVEDTERASQRARWPEARGGPGVGERPELPQE